MQIARGELAIDASGAGLVVRYSEIQRTDRFGAGQLAVPDDGGTAGTGDEAAALRALQSRKGIN